jgi:hypothetical protein
LGAGRRPEEPPHEPAVPEIGEKRPDHRARFGLELGGAAVMGGAGAAFLPLVRFDLALRSRLWIVAALAGFGTRTSVENQTGSARMAQGFALLGAAYRFQAGYGLRPFLGFSAGALHTSVEGQADQPDDQGRHVARWSFLLDAGGGAGLQLSDRLHMTLAVHAQVAQPYIGIRFGDKVVGTSARPNLLATLTLGAWL